MSDWRVLISLAHFLQPGIGCQVLELAHHGLLTPMSGVHGRAAHEVPFLAAVGVCVGAADARSLCSACVLDRSFWNGPVG